MYRLENWADRGSLTSILLLTYFAARAAADRVGVPAGGVHRGRIHCDVPHTGEASGDAVRSAKSSLSVGQGCRSPGGIRRRLSTAVVAGPLLTARQRKVRSSVLVDKPVETVDTRW